MSRRIPAERAGALAGVAAAAMPLLSACGGTVGTSASRRRSRRHQAGHDHDHVADRGDHRRLRRGLRGGLPAAQGHPDQHGRDPAQRDAGRGQPAGPGARRGHRRHPVHRQPGPRAEPGRVLRAVHGPQGRPTSCRSTTSGSGTAPRRARARATASPRTGRRTRCGGTTPRSGRQRGLAARKPDTPISYDELLDNAKAMTKTAGGKTTMYGLWYVTPDIDHRRDGGHRGRPDHLRGPDHGRLLLPRGQQALSGS
jgi:hypothetical protein